MKTRHVQVTSPESNLPAQVAQVTLAVQCSQTHFIPDISDGSSIVPLVDQIPAVWINQQHLVPDYTRPVIPGNGNCDLVWSHQASPNGQNPDEDSPGIVQAFNSLSLQDTMGSNHTLVTPNVLTSNETHESNSSLFGGTNVWTDDGPLYFDTGLREPVKQPSVGVQIPTAASEKNCDQVQVLGSNFPTWDGRFTQDVTLASNQNLFLPSRPASSPDNGIPNSVALLPIPPVDQIPTVQTTQSRYTDLGSLVWTYPDGQVLGDYNLDSLVQEFQDSLVLDSNDFASLAQGFRDSQIFNEAFQPHEQTHLSFFAPQDATETTQMPDPPYSYPSIGSHEPNSSSWMELMTEMLANQNFLTGFISGFSLS